MNATATDAIPCDHCNRHQAAFVCGGCAQASYCSFPCGQRAWGAHSGECAALAAGVHVFKQFPQSFFANLWDFAPDGDAVYPKWGQWTTTEAYNAAAKSAGFALMGPHVVGEGGKIFAWDKGKKGKGSFIVIANSERDAIVLARKHKIKEARPSIVRTVLQSQETDAILAAAHARRQDTGPMLDAGPMLEDALRARNLTDLPPLSLMYDPTFVKEGEQPEFYGELAALSTPTAAFPRGVPFVPLVGADGFLSPLVKMPETRNFYLWVCDDPRPYKFSKNHKNPLQSCPWSRLPALDGMRHRIARATGEKICEGALINFYPGGKSVLSYHTDNDNWLIAGVEVPSLSFGEVREFAFEHVNVSKGMAAVVKMHLGDGSLVVMGRGMQDPKGWKHSILPGKATMGPRINVTFRHLALPPPPPVGGAVGVAVPPPTTVDQEIGFLFALPTDVVVAGMVSWKRGEGSFRLSWPAAATRVEMLDAAERKAEGASGGNKELLDAMVARLRGKGEKEERSAH